MRLYTTTLSANGRKPLALCRYLDLELEMVEIDVYRGEGQSAEYLAVNPQGKIPTLVDGDVVIAESNAILLYLAEISGSDRLWGACAARRAEVSSWLFWEASQWQPTLVPVLTEVVAARLQGAVTDDIEVRWRDPAFVRCASHLESELARRPYVAGDGVTLADFAVGGMTTYFRVAGFPTGDWPAIAAWLERIESLEAWQSTAAPLWQPA